MFADSIIELISFTLADVSISAFKFPVASSLVNASKFLSGVAILLANINAKMTKTNIKTIAVTKQILDYEPSENSNWNPTKVESKEDLNALLAQKLQVNNCVAIQGPPGTGKTYRLAALSAELLKQGKSVLVTALTNQALIELAKKKDLLLCRYLVVM